MKIAAPLKLALLCWIALLPVRIGGQGLAVDIEEFKRLAGEVADLKEANQAQQRRIRDLTAQVESLRTALRESNERHTTKLADFATRDDLKKIVDSIREVDDKRESDKKLILDQIKDLGKVMASAPVNTPERTAKGRNRERESTKENNEDQAPMVGEFYEYKVQKNDVFSKIVSDWNATLKEKGKKSVSYDDVKRANPKVNVNRIYEGQKLLLPLPSDKK